MANTGLPPLTNRVKGDEAFITTQLVGRVAPGSNKASNSPGCDVIDGSVDGDLGLSPLTLHRFASLLFDRDDLMPGELKGLGGRGKFENLQSRR